MIETYIAKFAGFVWYYPVVILCLFTGVFFTFRLLFIQLRCIPHAFGLLAGKYDDPEEPGQITHFQALSAALSGTIGLGNIAGVAIAIAMGGPGAVLWMWIVGFLGMATKYAECSLSTKYRIKDPETGEVRGGPMHYITEGLGQKFRPLAVFYAFCIMIAGVGSACMFQSNQAAEALYRNYEVSHWITGVVLFVLSALVIIGGIKRIGKVASRVVPTMCLVYMMGALLICLFNVDQVVYAFQLIFEDAFTGEAAAGGVVGSVIIWGVRRAIFSNEAGLGSAAIAHAAVKTKYPIREGIVASVGPLIDTVLVCTATALVIIMSGSYGQERYKETVNLDQPFYEEAIFSSGWRYASDSAPDEKHPLKKIRSEHPVVEYRGGAGQSLVLPVLDFSADAIRFSYYKDVGDFALQLNTADGHNLGFLQFKKGHNAILMKDPKTGESQSILVAKHYDGVGEWKRCILDIKPLLRTLFKKGIDSHLVVRLVPMSDDVHWYFDEFESVNAVNGINLTIASFDHFFKGFGSIFITIAVFFFAFSTMITWCYYGEVAACYLFGKKVRMSYQWFFVSFAFFGAILQLDVVINFSDAMIGLLVLPNSIAIILLSPKVVEMTKSYFTALKKGEIRPYR